MGFSKRWLENERRSLAARLVMEVDTVVREEGHEWESSS
jgi:hypothetical protein